MKTKKKRLWFFSLLSFIYLHLIAFDILNVIRMFKIYCERELEKGKDTFCCFALVHHFNGLWPTSEQYPPKCLLYLIHSVSLSFQLSIVWPKIMSGKNRRNNNQRQSESDSTIASVQCDGLVSVNSIKFNWKFWEIRWNLMIENLYMCRCVGICRTRYTCYWIVSTLYGGRGKFVKSMAFK